MDRIYEKGMRESWTPLQYREGLEKLISRTRQKLKHGEIHLNKHTREAHGLPLAGDK